MYLMSPLILATLILENPLILYTIVLKESLGALLAQTNKERKDNTLYYLIHHLILIKVSYPPMEKHFLDLVLVA